jgi:tetratricopeptide (TPR) repeat protein
MRTLRFIIILLMLSTLTAKAQTVIDLNNGGKVRNKTLRDYDREVEIKIAREDSIKYADCLKRAFSALHCDSLTEAKKFFQEALILRPKAEGNYIIEQHLGEIAEVEGDLLEAEAHYSKALKQRPDQHHIRYSRAAVAVQVHHFNEAKTDCDQLLNLSPTKEERCKLLFIRATALMGLRINHEARKDLETVCLLDPKNENAILMLALSLHDDGRSQEALERLNIHLRLNPENVDAITLRASILEALNLCDLALIDYDEAIRLAPDNADLYTERASCLEKLGKKSAAEKDLLMARKLRTKQP